MQGRCEVSAFTEEPPRIIVLTKDPATCSHGIHFDEVRSQTLDASEVRRRWPRFFGTCASCGYKGIYYASYAHYISGDW